MMSIINKIFVDSNVLIESIKGNKTDLLIWLLGEERLKCFINETVISEFMFHYLNYNSPSSPLSLKASKKIAGIISIKSEYKLLAEFQFLETNSSLITTVPKLMSTYNLLPNDAIIIATCKLHAIPMLASYDSELIPVCKKEEIQLITDASFILP